MRQEEINHFETFGFIHCKQLFSPKEIAVISDAFDTAMEVARGGAAQPKAGDKRQQVIPFFDYDPDTFFPLLDDERIVDIFANLMGDDFLLAVNEGIIHTAGSRWHHDSCAPEGLFSMRAAMYLDAIGPDEGCLNVIPGSHNTSYREALQKTVNEVGVPPENLPGRYPLCNQPGDVIFMNHKVFHSAFTDNPGRRAIHINCVQNTTREKNEEHFEWLLEYLRFETERWGRFYGNRLIATAGPRRKKMLKRVCELGFGTTGAITHVQDRS